jgi:hypothetical protein
MVSIGTVIRDHQQTDFVQLCGLVLNFFDKSLFSSQLFNKLIPWLPSLYFTVYPTQVSPVFDQRYIFYGVFKTFIQWSLEYG